MVNTSSRRLLCSFCSSMRFCLSANSKRLYSSFCFCSSCCRCCASERSLLASWRRRKSRLRVDSPGMLMMELRMDQRQDGTVLNQWREVKRVLWKVVDSASLGYICEDTDLGSPISRSSSSSSLPLYSYSVSSDRKSKRLRIKKSRKDKNCKVITTKAKPFHFTFFIFHLSNLFPHY